MRNIFNTYEKEGNTASKTRTLPVLDFFRKEINETRIFVRQINSNKKYSPKLARLAKNKPDTFESFNQF